MKNIKYFWLLLLLYPIDSYSLYKLSNKIMGFNVSVYGNIKENDKYYDCQLIIDRGFYNFTTSYELFGEESVLKKSGEFFGLDLKPLAKLYYLEGDEKPPKDGWQDLSKTLLLLKSFQKSIKENPNFINKVNFTSKSNTDFINYFNSGEISTDLMTVIKSIECFQKNGATKICFVAS